MNHVKFLAIIFCFGIFNAVLPLCERRPRNLPDDCFES